MSLRRDFAQSEWHVNIMMYQLQNTHMRSDVTYTLLTNKALSDWFMTYAAARYYRASARQNFPNYWCLLSFWWFHNLPPTAMHACEVPKITSDLDLCLFNSSNHIMRQWHHFKETRPHLSLVYGSLWASTQASFGHAPCAQHRRYISSLH